MIITDWSYLIIKSNVKVKLGDEPQVGGKMEYYPCILPKLSALGHLAQKQTNTNLWQLHLHVGKNMQEPDHSVPQPAVSETLLVANARSLETTTQKAFSKNKFKKCLLATTILHHADLYVLCQGVEDLLGHCQRSGEVPLPCFIHDILPRVVPVEITDGFLMGGGENGLVLQMKESGTFSD